MKKFLLSLAVMALGVSAASATVYNVNDATAIDGTDVAEKPAQGTSNGTARHYDPLNSLKIGDFTFTFSKNGGSSNPAYYFNMSTSSSMQNTIRLYLKNTMTISAETSFGKIVMKAADIKGLTDTNLPTASAGGFTLDATNMTLTWVNSEKVNSVTFTMPATKGNNTNPQIRITEFDITADTGDVPDTPDPVVPEGKKFQLVDKIVDGQYAFVASDKYGVLFTKNYGYWSTTAVTIKDNAFEGDANNALTISAVAGKDTYSIKDSSNKYLGQDTEHKNTFQLTTDFSSSTIGCEWTITFDSDKNVIVTNTLTGRQIMQDPQYGSFGCYKDTEIKDTFILPKLYKLENGGSGVAEIEAEAAGEAVYYNLQGVKVAEPENGLYIKVQGNKATKVLVRK